MRAPTKPLRSKSSLRNVTSSGSISSGMSTAISLRYSRVNFGNEEFFHHGPILVPSGTQPRLRLGTRMLNTADLVGLRAAFDEMSVFDGIDLHRLTVDRDRLGEAFTRPDDADDCPRTCPGFLPDASPKLAGANVRDSFRVLLSI